MAKTAGGQGSAKKVTIKKYANRRLYDTESSSYITLDKLAAMIRDGRDFEVVDAKSGEDITHQVLTQIIVEEEARGQTMLPVNFLMDMLDATLVTDTSRRPWEMMETWVEDYKREDLMLGYMYAASGRKPEQIA